jgi:hypothetical protein
MVTKTTKKPKTKNPKKPIKRIAKKPKIVKKSTKKTKTSRKPKVKSQKGGGCPGSSLSCIDDNVAFMFKNIFNSTTQLVGLFETTATLPSDVNKNLSKIGGPSISN